MKTLAAHYRAPLIWLALLVAGLIWLCLPLDWQPWWPVLPAVVLMTAMGVMVLSRYGISSTRNTDKTRPIQTAQRDSSCDLPIILVVGPYATALFEHGGRVSTQQHRGDAMWILVRTRAELAGSIAAIREAHQRLPDAVLMPVVSDGNDDEAAIRREFSGWRRALGESAQGWACVLPCHIAIYACLCTNDDPDATPVWFGDAMDPSATRPGIENAWQLVRSIRSQLDQASIGSSNSDGMTRMGLGHAVFDWLEDSALLSILSSVANTAPFSLHGLWLADIGYWPMRPGAWMRWLTAKTGLLMPPGKPRVQSLPLPEVIARQITSSHAPTTARPTIVAPDARRRRAQGTMAHVAMASSVVLIISIAVSAWANSRMIVNVADEINAFRHTSEDQIDAKRERLDVLQRRYAELTRYAHSGVPAELGWGLYRGEALQAALKQTIATWRPPTLGTAVDGMTIDNLSLFDSGKTTLKPDAEHKLQAALDLIRAHPDKRVVIAGHTDDVGSRAANLKLSEARARAIRDWFVGRGSLPVTRFAIQGYGDTRPLASNSNAQGREMNRRVEISLILDPGTR